MISEDRADGDRQSGGADTSALPFSVARKVGSFVFVSGQLALQEGKIAGDDVAAQTGLVLDAIERQLVPFGLGLRDVVKAGVWLVSRADFPAFNAAYAARFDTPYPTRSTVISDLALPGALVEIDAIAAFPE